MNPSTALPHVVIVGGGIAGLAEAFFLRDEPVLVTVLEGSPAGRQAIHRGGLVPVDEGAEALLATRQKAPAHRRRAGC
jgi:oxygen-dependent protoporphyrinogen oxidase